jgi:TRAP-type C4-dicarboxylate transport system permease small subunit
MRKALANLVEGLCAAAVLALALVVFLQVLNRYVMKTPLPWSEDLAMLLFQWVAFLGAALAVKRWQHFGIETAVKALPQRAHRWLAWLVPLPVAAVAVTLVIQGVVMVRMSVPRTYASMGISYLWAYLPIPISGALMLLYLARRVARQWRGRGGDVRA